MEKLYVDVQVAVFADQMSTRTAAAVKEVVHQGFLQEVMLWNLRLAALPEGKTESLNVSHLNGREFIMVYTLVNRAASPEMMTLLAECALNRVQDRIGDTVGMGMVEEAMEATPKPAGPAGDLLTEEIRSVLKAVRRTLFGK